MKKPQSFFSRFSLCAKPEEDEEQPLSQSALSANMNLSKNQKSTSSSTLGPLQHSAQQHFDDFIAEFYRMNIDNESPEKPCSEIFQLEKRNFQEETKQSLIEDQLTHVGDGLLASTSELLYQHGTKLRDSYHAFIMKVFHSIKQSCKLSPQQEIAFVKQLLPQIITENTIKRTKQDIVLVAHDPTGSVLIKHLAVSQAVYYIEESRLYSPIIDSALSTLNQRHKFYKVFKSDLVEKVDTAIVNLFHHSDISISSVIREYLSLAYDLILILSGTQDYQQLLQHLKLGLADSQQAQIQSGVEIQNIYFDTKLIARVVFYGEVSKIKLNHQLNYLYNSLSVDIKRQFKYKFILRELRRQIGMMPMVKLMDSYQLLAASSIQNFLKFYNFIKSTYLAKIKSTKLIENNQLNDQDHSSTESEEDDFEEQISIINTKKYRHSQVQDSSQFMFRSHQPLQNGLSQSQQYHIFPQK